ncbi:MAG: xanthine dehydrogenase accessory protein XdhC [Cypionkella sp.]|uniref:xanthine dehydrogenase accessory protein XdhC n=1 Tax=Cypionkella sp. TaxID=2811411 RepID=UPI002ABA1A81|nr:xanthine dehydrogenase accessory protein XdhC [Cypionkella sp.]MDZ4312319.1 xanthine dehydrogenase accessory protein XdhC [Cypionkella sp.]MDZ4394960.1 xanthine dehydrogenase accessory protein XdhC [Cypionkella sp.]
MFDLTQLAQSVAQHGPTARVVIAAHQGSSPREVGAAMLVWATGQSGTIGGGALEHQATEHARALLLTHGKSLTHTALGPKLNQCCGGAVTLFTEVFTAETLPDPTLLIARPTTNALMPLAVKRLLASARNQGALPSPHLLQGWMIEPLAKPQRQLWIWGAGHVGRALVHTITPLPDLHITWIDTAPSRFPTAIPENTTALPVADPSNAVHLAPKNAEHLILTYSHALDLDLCHRLLLHGFRSLGLIGSQTKWARFQSRLRALGHPPQTIAKITCPIGDPSLGKHPQAIAIGVAAHLLRPATQATRSLTA